MRGRNPPFDLMTSTASNSSIDICARALILIGAEPITSFSDNTTEALVASNMYEDVARSSLTNCRWRFATDQAQLARLMQMNQQGDLMLPISYQLIF